MQEPLLSENLPEEDGSARIHAQISPQTRRRPGRLLDRDAAFFQSRGVWRVEHTSRDAAILHHALDREPHQKRTRRFWNDWFYVLAYQKTFVLLGLLFGTYAAIVFVFAFIYLAVSWIGKENEIHADGSITVITFCDMDIHDHMEALYFSLSTMTTIGYGVSDYYFSGCWTPLLLVISQACSAITFNAIAVGLLFQRISRGRKRGKSILFSNKAIIRRVQGLPYFMFRVAELRQHHLLEATVRAYCVRHERHAIEPSTATVAGITDQAEAAAVPIDTFHYVSRPMRLLNEAAPHILMSLPQVVSHCIDASSPLSPPTKGWYDCQGHCRIEAGNGQPAFQEIDDFLRDRCTEIVVLLEGTDELTGARTQTRHSYTVDDLAWNKTFAPCVFPIQRDNDTERHSAFFGWRGRAWRSRRRSGATPVCSVDFARFHDTIDAPDDSTSCPCMVE